MYRVTWRALLFWVPKTLWLAHPPLFAGMAVSIELNPWKGDHTSQFSRTRQRLPATDLSGMEPLAESLTTQSNLAKADPNGLSGVVSSAAALSLALSSG